MVIDTNIGKRNKMWGTGVFLIGTLGLLFLGGSAQLYAAPANPRPEVRTVSGEIAYINIKAGTLTLQGEETNNRRYPKEFRINNEQTRVTDPTDKKFLVIKDLREGQHVTVEFDWTQEEWKEPAIAKKIVAYPIPDVVREATGQLAAIDAEVGTIIIEQRPLALEGGFGNLYYFVFEPKNLIVMKAPSMEPVQLFLKPGDMVKVVYIVRDGMRHIRSVTLLEAAPEATSTTTTTTTTSIRKIIVEPAPAPASQEATGALEAIDTQAGTLMIEQKALSGETGGNNLFFFVFDPKELVVMKAQSTEPVQLELNPGDIVKVEFTVQDGKRHASSITLVSATPETAGATSTTTTNTTVTVTH
ncbi:MAG: hypothetical protein HQL28_01880 [Candidatus Omnitrophica bacterium]|nr:hypothetical protein [Candidatus Omnitrophota bacterium]